MTKKDEIRPEDILEEIEVSIDKDAFKGLARIMKRQKNK